MAKNGLRAAGYGSPGGPVFSEALIPAFARSDTFLHGAFALEQGFIFASMILAAITVSIIEQEFARAASFCLVGAVLSLAGLMHSYQFTPGDTAALARPALPWAVGYGLMAAVLFLARWVTVPNDEDGHP